MKPFSVNHDFAYIALFLNDCTHNSNPELPNLWSGPCTWSHPCSAEWQPVANRTVGHTPPLSLSCMCAHFSGAVIGGHTGTRREGKNRLKGSSGIQATFISWLWIHWSWKIGKLDLK